MGQRYRRMEYQKPWSGLPKLNSKIFKLGDVLSKFVIQTDYKRGSRGFTSKAGRLFGKTSYFKCY